MPKLEAQSPVTREMAVEAAKKQPSCNCLSTTSPHYECVMARFILQSPPLAAWDEKRCRDFVCRIISDLAECETGDEESAVCDKFTAELASMPGGRVEGEVLEAVKRLTANSWDTYLGKAPRNWQEIADAILNDGRLVANIILSGRGVDDSGWRPVSDVPADDTWWHVWLPNEGTDPADCVVKACYDKKAWDCPNQGFVNPTHYRPLPTEPLGIVASGKGEK